MIKQFKPIFLKLAFPFGLICFILLGLWGGWWDEIIKPSEIKVSTNSGIVPEVAMNNIRVSGWSGTKKTWQVEARKVWQEINSFQVYFEKVTKGVVYSVRGQRLDFDAKWVRLDKFRNELNFGGGIHAKIDKGKFISESAIMNYKTQEINFKQKVTFKAPEYTMKADRMQLNLELEEMKLDGNVYLEQTDCQIRADSFKYYLKEDQYFLEKPEGVFLNL